MTDEKTSYDLTTTGASSVDTSNDQGLYSMQDVSLSDFKPQDSDVPATNSSADDLAGSYEAHSRSDWDEGARDPVTGRVYHPED